MVDLQAVGQEGAAQAAPERVEVRTVSMYPSDWRLAERLADEMASNVSAVLRFVVRQWAVQRRERAMEELRGDDGEGSG